MSAAADALMGIFWFKRVEIEMKTVEETRRELFEAEYCRRNECDIEHMQPCGSHYFRDNAQIAWGWFNAALDAVVIELPSANNYMGCNLAIEDCRAAIQSTSLGLKII